MASRSLSPGGALLRASRVFSIPPPLPRPAGDLSSQAIFGSDSATLPHPIHQSITTPQSSLARGDWGFKRPLPLRSTTKSSTPFIRVEAIDTFEHITEFNSSADHTISLQKWQEMGVPLTVPVQLNNRSGFKKEGRRSVFEDEIDSTADESRPEDDRWKFKGPWLAGQTDGDFNTYIVTEVRKRKGEFQQFIRESCANALTREARRTAAEGERPPAVEASEVTEQQLTEYIKTLRDELTELYKLIRSFLDLPPAPSKKVSDQLLDELTSTHTLGSRTLTGSDYPQSLSPYAAAGPPKTHPSAGLAYSRSSAYLSNHPEWGPQKNKRPVKARVVMPKNANVGSFQPVLGVGGFVTPVPGTSEFNTGRSSRGNTNAIPGTISINPEIVGGSKTYVQTTHARIDPKGRVLLTVALADDEAVAVAEGTAGHEPPKPLSYIGPSPVTRSTGFGSFKKAGSRGYGLSFDDEKSIPQIDANRELAALLNEER